jgi:hypothetical protein
MEMKLLKKIDPEKKKKKTDPEKKEVEDRPEKKMHTNESMQSEIQKEKQMVQHLEWMNCTPKRWSKQEDTKTSKPFKLRKWKTKEMLQEGKEICRQEVQSFCTKM